MSLASRMARIFIYVINFLAKPRLDACPTHLLACSRHTVLPKQGSFFLSYFSNSDNGRLEDSAHWSLVSPYNCFLWHTLLLKKM